MKKALLPLVFLFGAAPALWAVGAQTAAAQTADEVIEKHLAAHGGRAAMSKLTSRKATGTVTFSTPAGDLTGPAELYSKAPNKTRAYITVDVRPLGAPGDMVIDQRFDGVKGVTQNSLQGDTEITGNQLNTMRNNVFPSPLLRYKEIGLRVDVLPKTQVNGRDAIVLLLTPKVGSPARLFIDAETYMLVRTMTKLDSAETGEFDQTSDISDYRVVDGVKVPFKIVNTNPLQTVTIKLDKVEHNVAIDDAMFVVKGQ